MVSGNGMINLYLKENHTDWGNRVTFEKTVETGITDTILKLEGIDFIAGQNSDKTIEVMNTDGRGTIRLAEEKISYRYSGSDPLRYNSFFSSLSYREALEKTFESDFPDGLMQLLQIFRAERAGDLVLSATPGYDLRARFEFNEHFATHGALNKEQMFVPVAINHLINTNYLRTVDLFPFVLKLMGKKIEQKIDGTTSW